MTEHVKSLSKQLKGVSRKAVGHHFISQHDSDPKPMLLVVNHFLRKPKVY